MGACLRCILKNNNNDNNRANLGNVLITEGEDKVIEDKEVGNKEVEDKEVEDIGLLLGDVTDINDEINNLCLKIHILGSGDKMQNIIENIFKEDVNENLKDKFKVTKQLKTEQFHWIAHIYKNRLINEDLCKEIEKEIKEDRRNKENEKIILKNQVILCFGNENTES